MSDSVKVLYTVSNVIEIKVSRVCKRSWDENFWMYFVIVFPLHLDAEKIEKKLLWHLFFQFRGKNNTKSMKRQIAIILTNLNDF